MKLKFFLILLTLSLTLGTSRPVRAASFTVNTTADTLDANLRYHFPEIS